MTDRTIDTVTFDSWRGQFQPPRPSVVPFIRSGVTGVGATKSAAQPQRAEISAVYLDDLAGCQSVAASLEALVGTFVTATDDLGQGYNHVLVESVTCSIAPSLGDSSAVLTCSIMLWPDDLPT